MAMIKSKKDRITLSVHVVTLKYKKSTNSKCVNCHTSKMQRNRAKICLSFQMHSAAYLGQ